MAEQNEHVFNIFISPVSPTQRRNFGGHRIDQRIISLHCDLIDAAGRDDTLMVA